ncbi:MAG: glutamate 5-kinase [Planctomycetaceae bacterium]|nr:glutamate 5-kinase [Planctomycetaceae bacterium]MBQ2820671.1 glutamate 5-kinase [Thermoguttaceae bacterium]
MIDILRQEILTESPTIVVKVGTRILTDERGHLSESQIESFANQLAEAKAKGYRMVLVSSGAVGSGIGRLGLSGRPTDLAQLQAVAAVGQSALIEAYNHFLEKLGLHAAQILLTADDLEHRTKYLNVRNTLNALLEYGAIPIINENDTLSVVELNTTFGDNDRLAALVADLIHAPLLILLSDIDGLYDGDPKNPESNLIQTVHQIDASIQALAFDRLTGLSKGGMASKLRIAHQITHAGGSVIIANGREPKILQKILNCEEFGTLFLPQGTKMTARKQWIGYAIFPRGRVLVDEGCARALVENGKSLLPIGIREVEGEFEPGDVIAVCSMDGLEIGRGFTNYSSQDLAQIRGKHSNEIEKDFPEMKFYAEVIHRDNLTLTSMVS